MANSTNANAEETANPRSRQFASRAEDPELARSRSIRKFAIFVLLNVLVANAAILATDRILVGRYANPQANHAITSTLFVLSGHQGNDSLGVMQPVIHAFLQNPKAPIYESVFFDEHTKFQYPLTSLLPFYGAMRLGVSDAAISQIFKAFTFVSVGLTVPLCFWLAMSLLRRRAIEDVSLADRVILALAFVVGALFYYPLVSSLSLGQIQALLTLAFTLALLCWISGREIAAGILIGLMTAVKPQYGLFFVWALARRKFGPAAAGLCCLAAICAVSIVVFGWHNNVEYLQVLRYIAPRGEGYFENQSMNGLLNRFLFNGNNTVWNANDFAPQNAIVAIGTTITSALLLAVAIFYPWKKDRRGGATDFSCMILASTMASPVAWVHHYAILLPVLVWLWFGDLSHRTSKWATGTIAVAYILMSNKFTTANFLAPVPFWNLLQSCFYFATVMVLILLLRSRSDASEHDLSPSLPETAP
jgi:hypothetical protein